MTADIPVRLLEALLAIADTGSFTAAAPRVHVSQPALSQSIRRLERLVGVRLVDRRPSGASLTPAGESLADDARWLLARLDGAVARAARAGDGSERPELVVGFGTTTPREITTRVLALDEALLGSRVRLQHVPWGQESARLLRGEVDVVLLAASGPQDPDHDWTEIGSYARLALFPANHALARRQSVRIEELNDEPIIDAGSDRDYWLSIPRPGGLMPPIVSPAARTVEEMTAFVSAGRGMAITSASVTESASNPAIRFVPIEDLPPVKLGLARLRDDERPRVRRFVEAATTALTTQPRSTPNGPREGTH
ncbi:MAG: LysR family transcriptional regulator [Acidobacteria bacterium]|nr:LysR family transcriptional regulator [Acidobacteriota bacterium]